MKNKSLLIAIMGEGDKKSYPVYDQNSEEGMSPSTAKKTVMVHSLGFLIYTLVFPMSIQGKQLAGISHAFRLVCDPEKLDNLYLTFTWILTKQQLEVDAAGAH